MHCGRRERNKNVSAENKNTAPERLLIIEDNLEPSRKPEELLG
jgi:hypothetical protein